jgi:hypothetical protein
MRSPYKARFISQHGPFDAAAVEGGPESPLGSLLDSGLEKKFSRFHHSAAEKDFFWIETIYGSRKTYAQVFSGFGECLLGCFFIIPGSPGDFFSLNLFGMPTLGQVVCYDF